MIIVKLQGGLGNQMFQFALGTILSLKTKSKLKIDISSFHNQEKSAGFTPRQFELNVFGNQYKAATNQEIKYFQNLSRVNQLKKQIGFNYPKVFVEPNAGFQELVFNLTSPLYLEGYFQSYRYFDKNENIIKELFDFSKATLDKKNKNLLTTIKNTNTVALHIRRGDYVSDQRTQQFHGNCTIEYYKEAINKFEKISNKFTYVFFSDDIDWVKENFKDLEINKLFVGENKGDQSWKDMYLMTQCNHNIIANSTFSWWGAFLNENKEKIVCAPSHWFANSSRDTNDNDLIPESWLRI